MGVKLGVLGVKLGGFALEAAAHHAGTVNPTVTDSVHAKRVTRHTSHVTRHTSHVTRHTSHVTRHITNLHWVRKYIENTIELQNGVMMMMMMMMMMMIIIIIIIIKTKMF